MKISKIRNFFSVHCIKIHEIPHFMPIGPVAMSYEVPNLSFYQLPKHCWKPDLTLTTIDHCSNLSPI